MIKIESLWEFTLRATLTPCCLWVVKFEPKSRRVSEQWMKEVFSGTGHKKYKKSLTGNKRWKLQFKRISSVIICLLIFDVFWKISSQNLWTLAWLSVCIIFLDFYTIISYRLTCKKRFCQHRVLINIFSVVMHSSQI